MSGVDRNQPRALRVADAMACGHRLAEPGRESPVVGSYQGMAGWQGRAGASGSVSRRDARSRAITFRPSYSKCHLTSGPSMSDARSEAAADLAVKVMRAEAQRIRASGVRPFGLLPTAPSSPEPAQIMSVHGSGTVRGALAGLLGVKSSIWTMTLQYGIQSDLSAPLIEITSDFRYDRREPPTVEDALTWRAERDSDPAGTGLHGEPAGETAINIQGRQQTARVTRLGGYSGLQFREEGVLVTVITRNVSAALPPIVKIADLEPFLKARDKISQKDMAAWFAAHRDGPGSEPVPGA